MLMYINDYHNKNPSTDHSELCRTDLHNSDIGEQVGTAFIINLIEPHISSLNE